LPFEAPPFDKIAESDYSPAIDEGMKRQLAEIETIANNPASPTFANTIEAMERSGDLLTRVSREIYAENAGALYLTCVLVRVDSATRTLVYANAGHPAGLMVGASGRRLLSRGGPPVGLFPETAYESEVVFVEAGDLAVIVSDGITEAIEEDGVAAIDVLNRTIVNIPEPRTPQRVCDALMEIAQRAPGPPGVANWQDDRTVLAFQFTERSGRA